MRKLSPSRLYKFLKVVVIIVTIISALIAVLQTSSDSHSSFEDSKRSAVFDCQKIHYNNDYAYNRCVKETENIFQGAIDLKNYSTMVAIFLPIFFFGGTWLYKYLFPKNDLQKELE